MYRVYNIFRLLIMHLAISINLIFLTAAFARDITFGSSFDGPCTTSSGTTGWCLDLKLCASALQSIRSGTKITHCLFEGARETNPIVCCPLKDGEAPGGGIVKVEEVLPPKIPFECGIRTVLFYESFTTVTENTHIPKTTTTTTSPGPSLLPGDPDYMYESQYIAGGIISTRNSWPWMVLLGREIGPNTNFFCSGILINENYVITAAHCVLDLQSFFVRLGEHDYNPDERLTVNEDIEDLNVTNIVFHPNYDIFQGYDDIALLQLAKNVTFRDEISPICLPWGKIDKEGLLGEQVTVAGWGQEEFFGFPSSVLREVNITVFHPRTCEQSFSTLRDFEEKFPQGMNTDNIICAGDVDGGKDSCEGDSGGPMMHHDKQAGKYELAGIISTGFGCGKKDFPGIYAPLERQITLQWIKDTAFQK